MQWESVNCNGYIFNHRLCNNLYKIQQSLGDGTADLEDWTGDTKVVPTFQPALPCLKALLNFGQTCPYWLCSCGACRIVQQPIRHLAASSATDTLWTEKGCLPTLPATDSTGRQPPLAMEEAVQC